MKKNNKTPKLRFSGYTDDWEQRKVTDLGEIYIGLVTTMTEHYTDQGHLLIRNSDIKDGYFEFGENPIYLDEEFSEQNKSRMHQLGDVITVHTGDIGTSAVIGENEVNSIGFATIVTRPNQEVLDSDYFATYLNTDTHKQWAISMATGDGRSNYNLKDYTKLVVPIPQIKEQKKIAACIGNLNNLIALHQRKLEKLQSMKKSCLQKMFPKDGATVPEIRFSEFQGDWEERTLGSCFDERLESLPDGELLSVTIGSGIKKFSELDRHDNSNTDKSKYKRVCIGDIAYNSMRMWQGASGRSPYEGIVSPAYTVVKPIGDIDTQFFAYVFKKKEIIHLFEINSQGLTSDTWNLKYPAFSKIVVRVPRNVEEQSRIARFLVELDELISCTEQEIEITKRMKKGCLQKMFV